MSSAIGSIVSYSKNISGLYEEYVLHGGDFDERVFLGDSADLEIGTPAKAASMGSELHSRMIDVSLQHFEEVRQHVAKFILVREGC